MFLAPGFHELPNSSSISSLVSTYIETSPSFLSIMIIAITESGEEAEYSELEPELIVLTLNIKKKSDFMLPLNQSW